MPTEWYNNVKLRHLEKGPRYFSRQLWHKCINKNHWILLSTPCIHCICTRVCRPQSAHRGPEKYRFFLLRWGQLQEFSRLTVWAISVHDLWKRSQRKLHPFFCQDCRVREGEREACSWLKIWKFWSASKFFLGGSEAVMLLLWSMCTGLMFLLRTLIALLPYEKSTLIFFFGGGAEFWCCVFHGERQNGCLESHQRTTLFTHILSQDGNRVRFVQPVDCFSVVPLFYVTLRMKERRRQVRLIWVIIPLLQFLFSIFLQGRQKPTNLSNVKHVVFPFSWG